MKRLIALSVALLVLMPGCAENTSEPQNSANWYSKLLSVFSKKQEETVKLAENQKEIYGKVKDINGNIMELQIGTIPSANGTAGGRQNIQGENAQGGVQANGNQQWQGERQGTAGTRQQGGVMPAGFTPPADGGFTPPTGGTGANGSTAVNTTARAAQGSTAASGNTAGNTARAGGAAGLRQAVQLTLTGEEKTYTIPVTTPVFVQTTAGTSKLSFNQITKTKVVKLIVETDTSGTESLVSIQIMQ